MSKVNNQTTKRRQLLQKLVIGSLFIWFSGCRSLPEVAPGKEPTGIMIEANDLFERVYFMKLNGGSEIGPVIPANYQIRKKFFLFNAEPGEYTVAAYVYFDYKSDVKTPLNMDRVIRVVDRKSALENKFTVQSGKMNYGGYFSSKNPSASDRFSADDWTRSVLKAIDPELTFSEQPKRGEVATISTLRDKKTIDKMKARVGGYFNDTPWAGITCNFKSCEHSNYAYSVRPDTPASEAVTILTEGCYGITEISIYGPDGSGIVHNITNYISGEIRVAPGKISVLGRCRVGNSVTSEYSLDIGEKKAGDQVVICTRVHKEYILSTSGQVQTSLQPSLAECEKYQGKDKKAPSEPEIY